MEKVIDAVETLEETTQETTPEVMGTDAPQETLNVSTSDAVIATGIAGALVATGFGIAKAVDSMKEKREQKRAEKEEKQKEKAAAKEARKPWFVTYVESKGYTLQKMETPKEESEESQDEKDPKAKGKDKK